MKQQKRTFADVQKIYNIKSFEDGAAKAKSFTDAGGVILARNLEHISSEVFTQEYPDLTFLQQGITINNEGGYAAAITKLKLGVQGAFKQSGSNTNTTGKITLTGESDTINVISREAESDWSESELKEAELQNINLPSRFIDGHNEVYNREIDEIGYLGVGAHRGLLNTNWATTSNSSAANSMSGLELYDAISTLLLEQWASVRNTASFKANRVVMPDSVYNLAMSKLMTSDLDFETEVPEGDDDPIVTTLKAQILANTETVMAALIKNFPGVIFSSTDKAEGDGDSVQSATVAFSTNRAGMQFRLPVALKLSSVHQIGHKYYFESMYRVAGLDVIESNAARLMKGL